MFVRSIAPRNWRSLLLRSSGAVGAASVLQDITTKSPTRASKYKAALKLTQTSKAREMTGDEALLDLVTAKLTKQQYKDIRSSLRKKNFIAYPPYSKVAEAKARCYPSGILVSEISASVELQALLDHTCSRIIMLQKGVVGSLHPQAARDLTLICKWGCDGSSGQSQYKQKFEDEASSDANIFLTSLVPLQIVGSDVETNKNLIVWKNPRPSSPRFCRPIRVQFTKETIQLTLAEQQYVNEQIESLKAFCTCVNGTEVIVKYQLFFTMIDAKVCNSVTGTSSAMRCYLCGATSKQFNNIELMKSKKVDTSKLGLGCSTLHAWIRFLETLLHIGYKLDTQNWQSRKNVDKELVKKRKSVIQNAFKKELSLNVDKPKAGFESSNDGNTARRFFENASVSAKILGVDECLLRKCHVILQVMSSGYAVNVSCFQQYCLETAELFVALYPWYCMPTTVHKVLIHGPSIVEWAPLPIGQMSEDAQEARNKDIKNIRENFSRKSSREKTMTDIFNRLLVMSDPLITSMGKIYPKKNKSLSPEAVRLLLSSDDSAGMHGNADNVQTDSDSSSEDSEESD